VRLRKLEEVLLSAVGWGVTVLTAGFTVKPTD
jgi:hypothetical protein